MPLAFLQNFGMGTAIIILIVAFLIFGHKLPSVMRGLGRSLGEFKKGVRESEEELEEGEKTERETGGKKKETGGDEAGGGGAEKAGEKPPGAKSCAPAGGDATKKE